MKVKELPFSILKSLQLLSRSAARIKFGMTEKLPVIVSLTTIPSRLHKVDITIRSLLVQTQSPEKIVLWLPETLKNDIPDKLEELTGGIFEIRYSPLTCSHKKLIHTLKEYPDVPIITCDDDFIYHKDWVKLLFREHTLYPKAIIANKVRKITYDENQNLIPYKEWIYDPKRNVGIKGIMPIGADGVLYPPKALHPTVQDRSLFLDLAPKADDLWFKAMSLLNNTESRLAENRPPEPIPVVGTQKVSLKKENIDKGKNLSQWQALQEYFKLEISD